MKSIAFALTFALVSAAPYAYAHDPKPASDAAQIEVPAAAQAAVTVVDRFGHALAASDFNTVQTLLAPDVLILETGGAERSREEYLGHHAIADALFLSGSHHQLKHRRARIEGDLVWVGSESELHAKKDGKPITLLSTETMVLKKSADGWRIVHIHWSSRPKPASKAPTKEKEPATPATSSSVPATPSHHSAHADDTQQLRTGAGMGQSKVADASGYPGPRHALDLAEPLALSATQRQDVQRLHEQMREDAITLGQRVIDAEAALGRLFLDSPANEAAIAVQVNAIAQLRAELRLVHLRAHLAMHPLLTSAQRERYAALRQ